MDFRKTFVNRKVFFLQLTFKVCDFLTNNENCCEDDILLSLDFSTINFVPKNERQQGKRRVLGSKIKYWIENSFGKNTSIFFSPNQLEMNAWKQQNVRKQRTMQMFLWRIS